MPVGSGKVTKSKKSRSDKDVTHDEIQALLAKLKEIVPIMPRNRRLSKLEIIQYVIDYIVDLQIALESRPGINARKQNPFRQPLGVLISPENACDNQEVDKVRPQASQSTPRPVLSERELQLFENLKSSL